MNSRFRNINPLLEAEPFQAVRVLDPSSVNVAETLDFQSQGDHVPTSPKDLQEYYEVMEKRELERRQSRGKLRRWSRKGNTKSGAPEDVRTSQNMAQEKGIEKGIDNEWELLEQQTRSVARKTPSDDQREADDEGQSSVSHMPSLIPPRWSYHPPDRTHAIITPPTSYRMSYQIHNPVGPRYYRNHHLHLLNLSAATAAQYPPSAFSSAFPPLAALPTGSPVHGLGLGHTHLHPHNQQPQFPTPETSCSSSESVLPTPDSSSGQGHDFPRQRKTSASGTAVADPVDLMDGSDPWGQKFHHDSPYDLGQRGKNEQGLVNGTWAGNSSPVVDVSILLISSHLTDVPYL